MEKKSKNKGWINKEKLKPHLKLDLGAGDVEDGEIQQEGFVLNDVAPYKNIDLVCDIREIDKFIPKNYCSVIRASHVLEHFSRKDVKKIVSMVYSLLEKGGKFIVIVPNFLWHAQLAMSGQSDLAIYYVFGGQKDEFDFHKTGFTKDILKNTLLQAGFRIERITEGTSIECSAIKD